MTKQEIIKRYNAVNLIAEATLRDLECLVQFNAYGSWAEALLNEAEDFEITAVELVYGNIRMLPKTDWNEIETLIDQDILIEDFIFNPFDFSVGQAVEAIATLI